MSKAYRNDDYLGYIREQPCLRCGDAPFEDGATEAAHVRILGSGGTGLKPSDYRTVPLCHECHAIQHLKGERTFWGYMEVRPEVAVAALIMGYLERPREGIEALEAVVELSRSDV